MLRTVISGVKSLSTINPRAREPICEICGSRMIERHCKIQCPNCGFTRDCSDP